MPKRNAAARAALFILSGLLVTSVSSGAESCDSPNSTTKQGTELSVPACVKICESVAERKNPALHASFEKTCRSQIESSHDDWTSITGATKAVGDVADKALLQCLPLAAKKSAIGTYEFVVGLPYLVSHVMGQLASAVAKNQLPAGTSDSFAACQQSAECRRAVGRNLLEIQNQENGSGYRMSDADVDAKIAGRHLNELLVESQHQQEASKQECLRDLGDLRRKEGYGGIGWSDDSNVKVYRTLASAHPHCPGLLKLFPATKTPTKETAKSEDVDRSVMGKLSFTQKLAVGHFCQEDFDVDFCSDIVQTLTPLPLVGPQTSYLKSSAALTTKSAAVAAKEISTNAEAGARGNAESAASAGGASVTPTTVGETRASVPSAAKAETSAPNLKSPYSPAQLEAQQKLIATHNGQVYASEKENLNFMAKVEAASKSPEKPALIFDTENAAMKDLNGGTANKDLVTSVTNLHKDILLGKVNALKAKYPGVDFDVYSDFKSVKVLTSKADGLSEVTQKALMKDFDQALIATNKEFAARLQPLGINVPKAGPPETWFHGGVDKSEMKSNLWAREDRANGGTQGFAKADGLEEKLQGKLDVVEQERRGLAESPAMNDLLDRSEANAPVPRADVFELTRKYDTADDLAHAVQTRYNKPDFTVEDATKLKQYANDVNGFSPPILIAKRETLDFAGAEKCGALSADMCGLGAENLHATARGLVNKKSLDEALPSVRAEEQRVTASFNARKEKLRQVMGNADCTGDDCLQRLSKVLSMDDKTKMMNKIARDPETRRIRMSMVGPGVAKENGVELLYHGEKIEATLRQKLQGKLPFEKLQKMTFGLDLDTVKLNEGTVNLLIGRSRGVSLSVSEREAIQKAFAESLESINGTQRAYQQGSTITRETKVHFIPGPGVITQDQEN